MVALLDSSVVIALAVADHEFHSRAVDWLQRGERFATTPITQGALVRFLVRSGLSGVDAATVLASIGGHTRHEFWPDDLAYDDGVLRHVVGHQQVTDAYLLAHARRRGGRLVTFDRGLADVGGDDVEWLA